MTTPLAPRPRLLSSLRLRFATAISGLVLLCTAACVTAAVIFLNKTLIDRAHGDLQHTVSAVSGYMTDQGSELKGAARLIADDAYVRKAVLQENHQGLVIHLLPYYADYLNVDVIDVIDARGRVLVRMENTLASGDSVLSYPSVRAALADRETVALEADLPQQVPGGGYALRATVPLRSGTQIIGAVVAGRQLSSIYASHIGRALNAQVNLIAGGQLTGSTLTDSHGLPTSGGAEPAAILERIATGRPTIRQTTENGKTVLSGIVPLEDANGRPVGAIEVVSALSPLYDLITQLSLLLVALGAVVVGLGTLLALAIARRLTRRLQTLEETASQIAHAATSDVPVQDLHPTLDASGDDEVASLSRSLSAMVNALDERMIANEQLYEAAQARVRELSGLAEIARLLTAGGPMQETLDLLSAHVCRLLGTPAAAIVVPGDASQPFIYGGYGLPENYAALNYAVLSSSDGGGYEIASQFSMRTGEVVWRNLETTLKDLPPAVTALRDAVRSAGLAASNTVPLRVQDKTVGTLTCFTSSASRLSDTDLSLLETVADQVAVAVENARLYARSRDLAALEERARLARELHDSVTQALFSMTLHARAAEMALVRDGMPTDGAVAQSLKQLLELTRGALAEMRALIFELRPGALGEEGLAAALRKHAAAVSAREGLAVDVEAPPERLGLDASVEEHLYRLSQEALHNVVKHARASHVLIRLAPDGDGHLLLEITDDGAGFEPDLVPPGHLGMSTMADRVRQVGGTLAVVSAPGEGTSVRAKVAIKRASREETRQVVGKGA